MVASETESLKTVSPGQLNDVDEIYRFAPTNRYDTNAFFYTVPLKIVLPQHWLIEKKNKKQKLLRKINVINK